MVREPASGALRVPRIWSKVVLPAPLAPEMEVILCFSMSKSTPLNTVTCPYDFVIPRASIMISFMVANYNGNGRCVCYLCPAF